MVFRRRHGQRSLVGCSPWGPEGSVRTERLHFHFSLLCIGEGNGNPLQCSCLDNPRDGGAWWAAVSGVAQSWTRLKRLSSSSSSSSSRMLFLLLLLSCSVVSDFSATSWTGAHQAALSMDAPGKNTGVGCHFLLQGSNLPLPRCKRILYGWSTREAQFLSGTEFHD